MTSEQAKALALNGMALQRLTQVRKVLDSCLAVQCQNGNWNYSPYQLGFANGMILAKALLAGDHQPQFLESPEAWLQDRHGGMDHTLPIHDSEFIQTAIEASVVSAGDEVRG